MALILITEPLIEPISIIEAKVHLNIDAGLVDDDAYIETLIKISRRNCEKLVNRAFITQTWDLYLDTFPSGDIKIAYPPLQSITHVKYKDTAGDLQTYSSSKYIVDIFSKPGRISLAYGQTWPSTYSEIQAVQIRFVAGYGDAGTDVPEEFKHAILLKISNLYSHRGDEIADVNMDMAVRNLLNSDWVIPI